MVYNYHPVVFYQGNYKNNFLFLFAPAQILIRYAVYLMERVLIRSIILTPKLHSRSYNHNPRSPFWGRLIAGRPGKFFAQ